MSDSVRGVVVAPSEAGLRRVADALRGADWEPGLEWVQSADELRFQLAGADCDAVFYVADDSEAAAAAPADVFAAVEKAGKRVPVIVIGTALETENAIFFVKLGAAECLTSFDPVRLRSAVERARETPVAIGPPSERKADLLVSANVFRNAGEGIVILGSDLRIKATNPAFCDLTGYDEEEIEGLDPAELDGGGAVPLDSRFWAGLSSDMLWRGEMVLRRNDGSTFPAWICFSAQSDAEGGLGEVLAIVSDITEQKLAEQELRHRASIDELTGLPNRVLYRDRFSLALARAQRSRDRMAVFFIDLDFFKEVNDTLGHGAGDKLLIEVSERITDCLRGTDTVARLGGDEFAVVLSDLPTLDTATQVAAKTLDAIERKFLIDGNDVRISASIGIAVYPEHGTDYETLVANADAAMYEVKRHGRQGCRVFDSGAIGSEGGAPSPEPVAAVPPGPGFAARFPGLIRAIRRLVPTDSATTAFVAVAAIALATWLVLGVLNLGKGDDDEFIADTANEELNDFSTASGAEEDEGEHPDIEVRLPASSAE